ncbi:unnamed protein product [Schistosoma mattheei]|uniref:Uncharacterized protein n=1 Tax=Schistosoma mattheei TaxID=31246 RepID=A0A183PKB8_9TREM|nr:unnamed protein product [Schistosoma mattheei]
MFTDATGAPSFRLLLHTEDDAVQLIRQNGKQQWIREEALANIVAVEVIDLPVSEFQAKIEEEFNHASRLSSKQLMDFHVSYVPIAKNKMIITFLVHGEY